jgi:hypothetical protein
MTSAAITVHQSTVFITNKIFKVKGVTALIGLRTTALTLKQVKLSIQKNNIEINILKF